MDEFFFTKYLIIFYFDIIFRNKKKIEEKKKFILLNTLYPPSPIDLMTPTPFPLPLYHNPAPTLSFSVIQPPHSFFHHHRPSLFCFIIAQSSLYKYAPGPEDLMISLHKHSLLVLLSSFYF